MLKSNRRTPCSCNAAVVRSTISRLGEQFAHRFPALLMRRNTKSSPFLMPSAVATIPASQLNADKTAYPCYRLEVTRSR